MHTVPPSYGPRRPRIRGGVGDATALPPATDAPTFTAEVVDRVADRLPDAPRDAPPSTYAVVDFLDGADGSIVRLAGLTLLRTVFVAPGIFIAAKITGTEMGLGKVLGFSLASSATITGGMVGYYAFRRRFSRRT